MDKPLRHLLALVLTLNIAVENASSFANSQSLVSPIVDTPMQCEALAALSRVFSRSSIAEQRQESSAQLALTSAVLKSNETLFERLIRRTVTQSAKINARMLLESSYPFHELNPGEIRRLRHRAYRILASPGAATIYESIPESFRSGDPIVVISPGRIHLEYVHHLLVEVKSEKGRPREDYYWMPGGLAEAMESPRVGVMVISDPLTYLEELKLPLEIHAVRFGSAIDRIRVRYPKSRLTYIGSSLGARIQIEELALNRRKTNEVTAVISLNAAMRLGGHFMRLALAEAWAYERIYGPEARRFMSSLVEGASPELAERLTYTHAPEFLFIGVDTPKRKGGHKGSDGIVDLQGALGRGYSPQNAISVHLQGLSHGSTSTNPRVHAFLKQIVPLYARGESLRHYQVQVNESSIGGWGDYSPVKPLTVSLSDTLKVTDPTHRWDTAGAILKKWGQRVVRGTHASLQFARQKWSEARQAGTRTAMVPPVIGMVAVSVYTNPLEIAGISLIAGGFIQILRHVFRQPVANTEKPAKLLPFSWKDREQNVKLFQNKHLHVEVLVLGIGGPGASTAAHLAHLGIKTALIGRGDFGAGASGNNSGKAHAYIKYLVQGYLYKLVQDACERLRFEKIAPHWIRPSPILLVAERNGIYPLWILQGVTRAYSWVYRLAGYITGMSVGPTPRTVSHAELHARVPGLSENVIGATEYAFDADMNATRITFGFAQYAHAHGAAVISHASLLNWIIEDGQLRGGRFQDDLTGQVFDVRADRIVNATGASIDLLRKQAGLNYPLLSPSLGVQLIVEHLSPVMLIFPLAWRGRMFLDIPLNSRLSKIGPTETPIRMNPEEVVPSYSDLTELAQLVFRFFPGQRVPYKSDEEAIQLYLQHAVKRVEWGMRPLFGTSGSRGERIVKEWHGRLWSTSSKMTGIRKLGEDVARALYSSLGYGHAPQLPMFVLPGGDVDATFDARLETDYFKRTYGTLAYEVFKLVAEDSALMEQVVEDKPWIWAEVVYAARYECVMTLNDFLWQRTDWARVQDLSDLVVRQIARLMAKELKWSDLEVMRQMNAFHERLQTHQVQTPLRRAA